MFFYKVLIIAAEKTATVGQSGPSAVAAGATAGATNSGKDTHSQEAPTQAAAAAAAALRASHAILGQLLGSMEESCLCHAPRLLFVLPAPFLVPVR